MYIDTSNSSQGRVCLNAEVADKLSVNAGSATQPIYFVNGVPTKTTYTLGASVPSDAKFTDTKYTHPTTSGNKHIPSGGKSGQILLWSADGTAVWGSDPNNITYTLSTGDSNGEIKISPSTGSAYNVAVKGLGTAAYTSKDDYVTLAGTQSISGKKTFTSGLAVSGRIAGGGDDEGIVVGFANNGYAGVCLGSAAGKRSVFYLQTTGNPYWRYHDGTNGPWNITHPGKSGTIALTSDIPTTMAWNSITEKPSTFPPSEHTHNYLPIDGNGIVDKKVKFKAASLDQFVGAPPFILGIEAFADGGDVKWQTASQVSVGYANSAGSVAWENVTGKPSSFAPELPNRLKNYQSSGVADANNVTESGFYYMSTTSSGGGNRPGFADKTNDYRILATGYSNQWAQQIATNFRSNEIFYRRIEQGTWKPWVQIQTTESADARYLKLSGGTLTGTVNSSGNVNLYGANAYFSLGTASNSSKCYFQTYNEISNGVDDANLKAGFGFGWSNSLVIDKSGNVIIPGDLNVKGGDITGNASSASEASLLKVIAGTTRASNWDGAVSGLKTVWRQAFIDSSITADSGDFVLGLRPSKYSSGGTELCMMIDGDYYAMGNKVLNAANYNDYAPTKTGGGASGTWGINITGSAGSVAWGNVTNKPSTFTPSSHTHSYITYNDTRSNNQSPDDVQAGLTVHLKANGTDGISDGGSYHAVLNVKDWGDYSGGPYWQSSVTANNNMYFRRSTSGSAWGSWQKVLSDNNYTDYTVTKTGSGASGTWGIDITGSASKAGKLNVAQAPLNSSTIDSFLEADVVKWACSDSSAVGNNDGVVMSFGWSDIFGAQLWLDDGSGEGGMKIRNRGSGGTSWNTWRQVLTDYNYNDYAPTKTGGGASGTWGISVTGNAATATKLATARTIRTNLASTSTASFDGSGNITPGVTGTLPIANGGTGKTTKNEAYTNLIHQGDLSNATTNLKRGMYSYGTSASNTPGSYGCVYNVIANNISEGVAIGGSTSGSWVWQVAFDTSQTSPYIRNSVNAAAFNSWRRFWLQGDSVTGAVWNDYAECRESDCDDFGYVLMETGDDSLTKTTERLSHFAGISSDTWGFSQGETEKAKTPIAVAGRVLAYTYQDRNNYKPGDCVCAAPGGTVDIMTDEEIVKYPHRIVGTVSCVPTYEEWGGGELSDRDPVKVNGRIWIKVR